MKFNSIISAAKHAGKQNVYNSYKLLTPFIPSFDKTILKSTRGTKDMYLLLDEKYSHVKFSSLSIKVYQAWNIFFQNLFFTFSFM
jgi:hypothetical protein